MGIPSSLSPSHSHPARPLPRTRSKSLLAFTCHLPLPQPQPKDNNAQLNPSSRNPPPPQAPPPTSRLPPGYPHAPGTQSAVPVKVPCQGTVRGYLPNSVRPRLGLGGNFGCTYIYCSRASCFVLVVFLLRRRLPRLTDGEIYVCWCFVLVAFRLGYLVLPFRGLGEACCRCRQIFPECDPLKGKGRGEGLCRCLSPYFGASLAALFQPGNLPDGGTLASAIVIIAEDAVLVMVLHHNERFQAGQGGQIALRENIGYSQCGCIMYLYYCIPYQQHLAPQGYAASTENSTPCALNISLTSRK